MKLPSDNKELYSNKMGTVYQSDTLSMLYIQFDGGITALNITCFLCLKKQLEAISLEKMANNLESDIEIFTPCACDKLFVLTLSEAYYLKDLLAGAKTMLELNRIIHDRLYRFSLV
jgi:hypothetical protein